MTYTFEIAGGISVDRFLATHFPELRTDPTMRVRKKRLYHSYALFCFRFRESPALTRTQFDTIMTDLGYVSDRRWWKTYWLGQPHDLGLHYD